MEKRIGKICNKHPELKGLRNSKTGTCVDCQKIYTKARNKRTAKTPEGKIKKLTKNRKTHRNRKLKTIAHYGGVCSICGIEDVDVLTMDHMNNRGSEHRQLIGEGSRQTYAWLIRNGFPSGFRILCFNCNIKAWLTYQRSQL